MKNDVLVIEDLDSDFEMMKRGFHRLDPKARMVRLRSVEDVASYAETADATEVPGLIVLDLRLTDGDGREVLADLRKRTQWRSVPVIVWSAHSEPEVEETCIRAGARAFVAKAADTRVARQNIECITAHWQSQMAQPS